MYNIFLGILIGALFFFGLNLLRDFKLKNIKTPQSKYHRPKYFKKIKLTNDLYLFVWSSSMRKNYFCVQISPDSDTDLDTFLRADIHYVKIPEKYKI